MFAPAHLKSIVRAPCDQFGAVSRMLRCIRWLLQDLVPVAEFRLLLPLRAVSVINTRLLGRIGYMPPAEYEAHYEQAAVA